MEKSEIISSMSKSVSVLTLVKNRQLHLINLMRGLQSSTLKPVELIIIHMNEAEAEDLPEVGFPVIQKSIYSENSPLPLAAARNQAAQSAQGDMLVFLDVDCIPSPTLLETYLTHLHSFNGLLMGTIYYLPTTFDKNNWDAKLLKAHGIHHPFRPRIQEKKLLPTDQYELFWTLSFAISGSTWQLMGGFDEQYQGYGAEDTDFAFKARKLQVPFALCNAEAYHQPHPVFKPPLQHFDDIVANASRFRQKWDVWPMEGWLTQFAEGQYIAWNKESENITVIRKPTEEEVKEALHLAPAGF